MSIVTDLCDWLVLVTVGDSVTALARYVSRVVGVGGELDVH